MSEVSVIVVTYNSARTIQSCVECLDSAFGGLRHRLIVVDNASEDETARIVQSVRPDCQLVSNPGNVGFAAANNVGIRAATGDVLVFLNPDTVAAPRSLRTLVEYLERDSGVGLVAPKLLYPDGRLQYSIRNFPSIANQGFEALFLHRLARSKSGRWGEVIFDPAEYESAHPVDWVSGAVMVARRDAVEGVGGFDEGYFLYAEELDLCHALNVSGWGVEYVPDAVVEHEHGDTAQPELFRLAVVSRQRYYRKHFSGPRRLALQAISVLGLALRIPLWAVRDLGGNKAARTALRNHIEGLRAVVSSPRLSGGGR